ncbi:1, 4-alpha-D-glucan glucohydrolase [Calycina marina]|uniref:Glucoamylase n=1 Tax=Calycina marina TaxID=1763456 RepID=A0A9P7YXI3_9HELO|nr:1, 4-alpha-D-glucan glucohydrolase [Calycina marina]
MLHLWEYAFNAATLVAICTFPSTAIAAPSFLNGRDLNSFVTTERAISLQGVLNNLGPGGSKAPGAGAGYVVASPSLTDPDYFYTWTRDSALTLKMLIDEFINGNAALQTHIEDYVHAQAVLQTVASSSGSFLPAGLGLGEPKYQVNGTRFNGAWGRPQRDGPALRAIALISYSNYLIKNGESKDVKTRIWPIIQNDLSYVGQYWNSTGFDLWEEIQGSSFFTSLAQHRALAQGTVLAESIDVTCTGCDQADEVLCFLPSYWNGKYIDSNINVNDGRTGLDGNSILGSIANFDINALCDSPTFQPCNSRSLANFKVLIDTFRATYAINSDIPVGQGVAVGRYAEDVYQGGNPWYLITTAAAEFLYDAVAQWKARHNLLVDATSLAFFQDLYPTITIRKYNSASGNANSSFAQIMDAVTAYADSFVAIVEKYTPADGALAEQFDRNTGVALSAVDLTWSYAAFVTMALRRSGGYPASWGTRNIALELATCSASSTPGVYVPAVAAGAPNVTAPCSIAVNFNVDATTYYGENIYVVGSDLVLGEGDVDNSFPLGAGNYPIWSATAYLTAGATVTYQYARQEDCGHPWILESGTRSLTLPACGGAAQTTNDEITTDQGTSGNCGT